MSYYFRPLSCQSIRCLISNTVGYSRLIYFTHSHGTIIRQLSFDKVFRQNSLADVSHQIPSLHPMNVPSSSGFVDLSHQEIIPSLVESWTMSALNSLNALYPWEMIYPYVEKLHSTLGLSWPVFIIGSACALRLLFFHGKILSRKNIAYIYYYKAERNEFYSMIPHREDKENMKHFGKAFTNFNVMINQHTPWILPILFFYASCMLIQTHIIKELSCRFYTGMYAQKFLWLDGLSLPDAYYIIPALAAVPLFFTVKIDDDLTKYLSGADNTKKYDWSLLVFPMVTFGALYSTPAAVQLFWCASNWITLLYSNLLKIDEVRNYFEFPKPKESSLQSDQYKIRWHAYKSFDGIKNENLSKEGAIIMDKAEADFSNYMERRAYNNEKNVHKNDAPNESQPDSKAINR